MSHHFKDTLISWLNDAHSMEDGLTRILENHANDAKDFPQIQTKLQQHLEVTKRHADMVKQEIKRLGGGTSPVDTVKNTFGNMFGTMQGVVTGGAEDQMIKNALSDYAAEHFEIACYKALIAGAQAYGDTQLVRTCETILRDEEEMAHFLEQHLPMLVNDYSLFKISQEKAA
jgi:ferritin-like metal-binding protein YciE